MAGNAKELRLGLVCYGGSSLSIYMHGVTKELHRLVRASALGAPGAAQLSPVESAYDALLGRLLEESSLPDLKVVVDVISGTSAGGINGIYLAKALAGNRSLDELRKLWFEKGDMNQLLLWPRFLRRLKLDPGVKAKIVLLLPRALRRSPLNGRAMVKWLYDALAGMDDGAPPKPASLMPRGVPLDLFVTITDFYGYQRWIALDYPRFVPENRHRHAVSFHYDDEGRNDFTDNGGLAFAARTTSSVPGVFPPVSLADVADATEADLASLRERCFRIYALNRDDPTTTYFVDGGVLDNKPFGWAIDTILQKRPAEAEVDRKLLYIEPDPHGAAQGEGGESPETLAAAIGALTTMPRSEPILDDLLGVQEHNEQVRQLRDVIETSFDRIARLVDTFAPREEVQGIPPVDWPWPSWNAAAHDTAVWQAGMTYATYVRAKISGVVAGIAMSINALCNFPRDSNHAALVRAAVHAWADDRGLFGTPPTCSTPADPCEAEDRPRPDTSDDYKPTDDQVAFLRAFDLGYVRRRTRFVIAAFNWWYRCVDKPSFPSRADLDRGKEILYGTIRTLDALGRLELDPNSLPADLERADALRRRLRGIFGETTIAEFLERSGLDGPEFARQNAEQLSRLFADLTEFLGRQLPSVGPQLLGRLNELTAEWDPRRRDDLRVRYLGFPIWDVLLYPIQFVAQAGEGDEIEVIRISPLESGLLPAPDGKPLEGVQWGHFYAFFEREARENDYLRGRLDAAEQLIRLLLRTTGSALSLQEACRPVFEAILAEDEEALPNIKPKLARIAQQVAGL